jgi:hypothetical protein
MLRGGILAGWSRTRARPVDAVIVVSEGRRGLLPFDGQANRWPQGRQWHSAKGGFPSGCLQGSLTAWLGGASGAA